jgi:endoglucanase
MNSKHTFKIQKRPGLLLSAQVCRYCVVLSICLIAFLLGARPALAISPPTFSPGTGVYFPGPTVTITGPAGAVIHVTQDGSLPTTSSPVYTSAITINASTTISAIAVLGGVVSPVATAVFTIDPTLQGSSIFPSPPIISVPSGTLAGPTQVAVAVPPDCICYYSFNQEGPYPTNSIPPAIYTGPINIYCSETLNVLLARNGIWSSVSSASYTLDPNQWPAPSYTDHTPLVVNIQSPTN